MATTFTDSHPREAAPDLLLVGGKILTADSASRIVEAMVVADGKVLAAGNNAEMTALAGKSATCIDLGGRTVIPGLIDGHAHMDNEGLKNIFPSLTGCRSIADVQDRIAELARHAKPGEWIVTMPIGTPPYYRDGAECLKEARYPSRHDLDKAAPVNPVYIKPILGYWRGLGGFPLVSIANSRALQLAGIGRETLPPWGGIHMDRDLTTGEPNGIFYEWTQISLVEMTLMRVAPAFSNEDRLPALRRSMAMYNAFGTTSVVETHGVMDEVIQTYRALEQAGNCTVRAHLVISPSWKGASPQDVAAMVRDVYGWCAGRGRGSDMVRVGGIYTRIGGSGADNRLRAAAMPYLNFSGYAPDSEVSRELVRELVLEAARNGMRVSTIYADCLELYEEANRVRSITENRWIISHLRTLTPDEIARIRDLGVVVTTQTNRWIADQGSVLRARLGPAREDEIVPLRRLTEAKVPFGLATDNTPVSLFHPLWHCVARRNARTGEQIAFSQRLSREEALRAATYGGACLTFEENLKGTLEPGKFADMAVLDQDYLSVPEDRIKDMRSVMTLVGGRIVHQSDDAPVTVAAQH
ncbi:MAG: amidohydrolase [Burkholderiales bacterium]